MIDWLKKYNASHEPTSSKYHKKDHQTYLEYVIFNAKHWIQTNTVITQTSDLKYLCFDPVWCLKSN